MPNFTADGGYLAALAGALEPVMSLLTVAHGEAPALTLALGALAALLVMSLASFLARLWPAQASLPGVASAGPAEPAPLWPMEAWLVADHQHLVWRMARHRPVRVGREGDNEVCLPLDSVNRYHAIIHDTGEKGFVITDVSSARSSGVIVNGERRAEAALKHGDRIRIGLAELVFVARPA